jgi:hypothetical protein
MKLFRFAVCVAGLLAAAFGVLYAQESAPKVAGVWKMSLETPHGLMPGTMQVKQDGAKISGSVDVEHMGTMALTGEVAGGKISFSLEIPSNEKVTFTGTIAGDKMSGSHDHGGSWSATRGEAHI